MFGLIGILIGRVPSWVAGLPLTLQSINDRFLVSMMIGGSLFLAGLLELIFRKKSLESLPPGSYLLRWASGNSSTPPTNFAGTGRASRKFSGRWPGACPLWNRVRSS